MKSLLVDTNVLVRFVTGEPAAQAKQCAALIRSAEAREIRLTLLPMVLAEAVYVLTGFYGNPRPDVSHALSHLLSGSAFHSPERDQMLHALKLFGMNKLDFVDCYLSATSLAGGAAIASFDKDFDKIHGVKRTPPGSATGG